MAQPPEYARREELADFRQEVRAEFHDVRAELRRLDDRVFHVLLIQLASLATLIGTLIAALAS